MLMGFTMVGVTGFEPARGQSILNELLIILNDMIFGMRKVSEFLNCSQKKVKHLLIGLVQ